MRCRPQPHSFLWISTRRRPYPTPSHTVHRRSHTLTARPSHPPPVPLAAAPSPSLSPNPGSQIPLRLTSGSSSSSSTCSSRPRSSPTSSAPESTTPPRTASSTRPGASTSAPPSSTSPPSPPPAPSSSSARTRHAGAAACSIGSLFYVLAKAVAVFGVVADGAASLELHGKGQLLALAYRASSWEKRWLHVVYRINIEVATSMDDIDDEDNDEGPVTRMRALLFTGALIRTTE
ncbi:uncharacterized protein [Aegilops tauschii subsp. strangulata]|uniref:uncharacterized protein isoform X1 n=1 Tax=Aegilops tauschii subsp. strangulata TaxID=200361 RepID=UPI003CC8BEEC